MPSAISRDGVVRAAAALGPGERVGRKPMAGVCLGSPTGPPPRHPAMPDPWLPRTTRSVAPAHDAVRGPRSRRRAPRWRRPFKTVWRNRKTSTVLRVSATVSHDSDSPREHCSALLGTRWHGCRGNGVVTAGPKRAIACVGGRWGRLGEFRSVAIVCRDPQRQRCGLVGHHDVCRGAVRLIVRDVCDARPPAGFLGARGNSRRVVRRSRT